jgi:hypothetical protein
MKTQAKVGTRIAVAIAVLSLAGIATVAARVIAKLKIEKAKQEGVIFRSNQSK